MIQKGEGIEEKKGRPKKGRGEERSVNKLNSIEIQHSNLKVKM
jgi:hypothetical protein